MAKTFVIPTKFTAVDKFSATVKKMGKGIDKFAKKTERGLSRAERGFRKITPGIGKATKRMLSFATAAALGAAVVGGIMFSFKSLVDYEKALASTQAITGTTNEEFAAFQKQIESVAKSTKKSSVEVAKGFEIVGSAAPELLKNSKALGEVTKASITLSKASGDDLATSAANLTGVMNQFSVTGGAAAIKTMNILAAGSVVGSSNITEVGESMKNFGSVAAGANLTMEESVALIEVMGKFSLKGAEAGTKLRGSVLKLQKAGLGYTSGQFNMNDALNDAKKKFDKLGTAKKKDAFLNKLFGAENVSTGKILLNNVSLFEQYTKGVTGTSTATEQAAIKSDTLSNRFEELKSAWVNMITGSAGASKGMEMLKDMLVFVANNLDTIVSVGVRLLLFLAAVKIALLLARGAMMVYNVALKLGAAASWLYSLAQKSTLIMMVASKVAMFASTAATYAVTAATWLWNAALMANPIGLIIIGIIAAVTAIYLLHKAMWEFIFGTEKATITVRELTRAEKLNNEVKSRALSASVDQRVEVTMLFQKLRKLTFGTEEYSDVLQKIDKIQPGITDKIIKQAGALEAVNAAEKELTESILKRAQAEARAEMMKEKFKAAQIARDRGPSGADQFLARALELSKIKPEATAAQLVEARASRFEQDAGILAEQQANVDAGGPAVVEKVNPKKTEQNNLTNIINRLGETLTIDFKNLPQGTELSGGGTKNISTPSLGTTN